jgi:hypothetical protein
MSATAKLDVILRMTADSFLRVDSQVKSMEDATSPFFPKLAQDVPGLRIELLGGGVEMGVAKKLLQRRK